MQTVSSPARCPRWLWLWLPLAYLPFESAIRAIDRDGSFHERVFMHEDGFVEMTTAVLLIPAALLAIRRTLWLWRGGARKAAALLSVFVLACLFLLGEETSYGQHFLGWQSPEYFQEHNLQEETNIHNLQSFNKSRLKWTALICMFVVGIVLPLAFRRHGVPAWLSRSALGPVLLRSTICLPTVVMAWAMHLAAKGMYRFYDFEFHDNGFVDVREITELYVAFFLLLYALALSRGLDASAGAALRRA